MKKLNIIKDEHIWYIINYLSPSCFKKFSYNSSLIKHMRIHTGERPYLCNVEGCNQQFSQVSSYNF